MYGKYKKLLNYKGYLQNKRKKLVVLLTRAETKARTPLITCRQS